MQNLVINLGSVNRFNKDRKQVGNSKQVDSKSVLDSKKSSFKCISPAFNYKNNSSIINKYQLNHRNLGLNQDNSIKNKVEIPSAYRSGSLKRIKRTRGVLGGRSMGSNNELRGAGNLYVIKLLGLVASFTLFLIIAFIFMTSNDHKTVNVKTNISSIIDAIQERAETHSSQDRYFDKFSSR